MNRRDFLKTLGRWTLGGIAGAGLLSQAGCKGRLPSEKLIPGKLLGPSMKVGHRLRTATKASKPDNVIKTGVVIVGGGIAGLSAAWWLQRQGVSDFTLLELESTVGGNARSGQNGISPYPWGAHYVPIPNDEAVLVKTLFEELGVITGRDNQNRPIYNPLYLCHEPEERLLIDGRWQEGLVPNRALQHGEREQIHRFMALMDEYRQAKGNDGKRAFAIPLAFSSQDPAWTRLDRISMAQWMKEQDFTSPHLLWYVNYGCRDDYGGTLDTVSAWAGIHYFAGRNGIAANAEYNDVLTWPEGNGWLVKRLKEKLNSHIQPNTMACRVTNNGAQAIVEAINPITGQATHYEANAVVCAMPRFIAAHVVPELQKHVAEYHQDLHYAPWMVANISLNGLPPEGLGAPLSWDNVSRHSESLGYVMATHQTIRTYQPNTVLTYYYPLTHLAPAQARQEAMNKGHQDWTRLIVDDLETMHTGIGRQITNIDVWVWGHGMIRPSIGFIWGKTREAMQEPVDRIAFAHSDMSGISIFEEAQYHGVEAAKWAISRLAN